MPVGQYAQEALTNLGLWDSIQPKVSFGTNVTEVLNLSLIHISCV